MPRPRLCSNWLRNNAHAREYLRGLARGEIPLTHDGLHDLPSWRTAAHLRDLLMASGALPTVDRQILLFERWYRQELRTIADLRHEQLLRLFTTWHLLPRMRSKADRRTLTAGTRNAAAWGFTKGRQYLEWLAGRGRQLSESTQADIDVWYATRTDPGLARTFLRWAMSSGAMPRLGVPARTRTERPPISQQRRLALVHQFLTGQRIPAAHQSRRMPAAALRPARRPASPPDCQRHQPGRLGGFARLADHERVCVHGADPRRIREDHGRPDRERRRGPSQ
jgi:hypothetical protein